MPSSSEDLKEKLKEKLMEKLTESSRSSVQESLAGLLPAAGGAPQLSMFNAVNFATFSGFSSNLPGGGAVVLQPLLSNTERTCTK